AQLLIVIILLSGLAVQAQTGSVSGTVRSDQGQPVEFASVSINGTSLGAATDVDGKFLIENVPAGEHILAVSSVGYGSITRPVTVYAGQAASLDIRLAEAIEQLQAVEITGRKERTYKNTSTF